MKETTGFLPGGSGVSVAIGLGANLGLVRSALDQAVDRLRAGGVRDLRRAPVYATRPVDCDPGTPDFLNTVVIGRWHASPLALLELCQAIEVCLGRPPVHSQHAARAIDLDLLLVGERQVESSRLTLPHPRLRQRLFVLVPLADLAPDWRVPPTLESAAACRDLALQAPGATDWGRRVQD